MSGIFIVNYIPLFVGIFMAVLGACFGSFAALIIWRLPLGQSIVIPRSYCPNCQRSLRVWENIPIFSYIFLRGKCFYCHIPIGIRLLVIELMLALALSALYMKLGIGFALIERFIFVFILVCLAYIDIDTFSLPISLLLWLLVLGIVSSLVYTMKPEIYVASNKVMFPLSLMVFKKNLVFSLSDRVLGAVIGGAFLSGVNLAATYLLRKSGRLTQQQWAIGWGDPLLLLAIGLIVGLSHLVLVIFLASALGSIIGIFNQILSRREINDEDIAKGALPFGPFLAIAAIYVYLF